jgi:hypothetical protein
MILQEESTKSKNISNWDHQIMVNLNRYIIKKINILLNPKLKLISKLHPHLSLMISNKLIQHYYPVCNLGPSTA